MSGKTPRAVGLLRYLGLLLLAALIVYANPIEMAKVLRRASPLWLLLGFIALRGIFLGKAVVSSFAPGEDLRIGALLVLLLYAGSAIVLALSIVRSKRQETT